MRERPAGVPEAAWWSDKDNEWILGDKDAQGRLQGLVTYWRPDGSLVCTCPHVDDKPHGLAQRFHETGEVSQKCPYVNGEIHGLREWFMTDGTTTEKPRADGIAKTVWRGELEYVNGRVVAFRFFDREGNPVDTQGKPLPVRPASVPEGAARNKAGQWTVGQWNEQGDKIGLHRYWTEDGAPDSEQEHDGDLVRITDFRPDGSVRVRYTLNATTKRLVGAATGHAGDGTVRVRASFDPPAFVEHLGPGGIVVRRGDYPPPISTDRIVEEPTEADRLVLDAIDEGDASAVDVAEKLSPAGLAHAIAGGWGGGDDRDAGSARALRKLVRKIADPSLAAALARLHLDRVSRIQTPLRADQIIRELAAEPSLDATALEEAMLQRGGPGAMLALRHPARAIAYLDARRTDDTLALANLGLTELPREIGRYGDVPRLYLEGNRLTTLPDEVGDMFRLAWLNLAKNRIASLPRTLASLPMLRTLYLSDNELTAIPPTVFELAELSTLSIGDNRLTEVPAAIGDLRWLDDLSLYDNQLRDLPAELARCPLTFLHLGAHDWEEPPKVLGEIRTLETLWLASRSLKRLTPEIVTLPNLKALMVWYSDLHELPDELYEAKQLKELRIKNNPLPDAVYARLAEALPNTTIY